MPAVCSTCSQYLGPSILRAQRVCACGGTPARGKAFPRYGSRLSDELLDHWQHFLDRGQRLIGSEVPYFRQGSLLRRAMAAGEKPPSRVPPFRW